MTDSWAMIPVSAISDTPVKRSIAPAARSVSELL